MTIFFIFLIFAKSIGDLIGGFGGVFCVYWGGSLGYFMGVWGQTDDFFLNTPEYYNTIAEC